MWINFIGLKAAGYEEANSNKIIRKMERGIFLGESKLTLIGNRYIYSQIKR